MLTLPITFSLAPFPTGSSLDADQYGQQLVANLTATFSGNFLTGQTGGTAPTSDIGPWFNLGSWWVWNASLGAYAPLVPSYFSESPIINGRMQVWQRKISLPAVANLNYTADRWQVQKVMATGVATASQSVANIPGTTLYPATEFSTKVTVTTPQAVLAAGESFSICQSVEKQMARALFDQTTSVSLLIKTNAPGIYSVSLRTSDGALSYIGECNVTSAGVFQRFVIQNIPPFPVSSNLGTLDTDRGYILSVCVAAGANNRASPLVWNTGNFVGSVNQFNLFSTVSNTFEFTLVKHESGITCTPYCPRLFSDVLLDCQRYYATSYDYGTLAGTITNVSQYQGASFNANSMIISVRHPVAMRIPTAFPSFLSLYSPVTGTLNTVRDVFASADRAVASVTGEGTKGFSSIAYATGTVSNIFAFHYLADVEL